MIRIAFLLFALFFPISAGANTTIVRSGEHADFSRLVIQFPDHPNWSFGRTDDGYEFRFDAQQTVLDVSKVFELIPKTRIQDVVVPGPGKLKLFVGCECHSDVFELRNGRIVVDIKDGPGASGSPFENRLKEDAETNLNQTRLTEKEIVAVEAKQQFFSNETNAVVLPPVASVNFVLGEELESDLLHDTNMNEGDLETDTTKPVETSVRSEQPNAKPIKVNIGTYFQFQAQPKKVDLARTTLLKSLQRAAAQGVVRIPQAQQGDGPNQKSKTLTTDNVAQNSSKPESAKDVNGHIRIETVVDRDDRNRAKEQRVDEESCRDTFLASIGSWGDPGTLQTPYDDLRSQLVGEFDELDKGAVEALVKRQIYLGFGAEALALIAEFPGKIPDVETLHEMAVLVDGGPLGKGSVLGSKIVCNGASVMWGLLAQERITDELHVDTKSVLQTFSALPVHLRKNFGPGLANRFLDIDDLETATAIKNLANRASRSPVPELGLLDARISDKTGETELSLSKLNAVYDANGPDSAIALAELIETQVQNGFPVDEQNARSADALAVEYRGTPLGIRLKIASIRGLVQTDPIEVILGLIDSAGASDGLTDDQVATLTSEVFSRNALFSDDETFLQIVFSHRFTKELSRDATLATASRLLKLGFSERARHIAELYDGTPSNATRLLLAEIAVSQGNLTKAKGILAGIAKPDKKWLSAQIDEQIGDLSKAARKYAEQDNVKNELSAAWRNNDWGRVARIDDGIMAKAAQLALERDYLLQGPMQATKSDSDDAEERLLESGRTARETLEQLLAETKSSL